MVMKFASLKNEDKATWGVVLDEEVADSGFVLGAQFPDLKT